MVEMVSIVLTAWREERTIGKCTNRLIDEARSLDAVELILVCPDAGTRKAAEEVVKKKGFGNYHYVKDPQKGKPYALNLAFAKAKGEIVVSTDGDVWVEKGALKELLRPFVSPKVGGVTGRPVCANDRGNIWGYWGSMFIDAAHERREETLGKGRFFAMSGYLLAVRNIGWKLPSDVLDDVYFSYKLHEEGYTIAYAPGAKVLVTQPTSMSDWLKQKVRSLVGYRGLSGVFVRPPGSRTLLDELSYAFYPLKYARSVREFIWSLAVYPVRLYLWVKVWWVLTVEGKKATEIWQRIDSTK